MLPPSTGTPCRTPLPQVARTLARALPPGEALFVGNSMPIRDLDMYACPATPAPHPPPTAGTDGSSDSAVREPSIAAAAGTGVGAPPQRQAAVPTGLGAPVAANRGASGIDGVLSTAAGFADGLGRGCTLVVGDISFLHDINGLHLLRSGEWGHCCLHWHAERCCRGSGVAPWVPARLLACWPRLRPAPLWSELPPHLGCGCDSCHGCQSSPSSPAHLPTPIPLCAGEMRPPLTVVLINNSGGGIFSFLPIADSVPDDVFTPLWATPQHVDLAGVCRRCRLASSPARAVECCWEIIAALWNTIRGQSVNVVGSGYECGLSGSNSITSFFALPCRPVPRPWHPPPARVQHR